MDNYLTMTASVEQTDKVGYYIITGPDKDNIDSEALGSGRRVISIEHLPSSGDEEDLVPTTLFSAANAADEEDLRSA